jgi:hypothetical protein
MPSLLLSTEGAASADPRHAREVNGGSKAACADAGDVVFARLTDFHDRHALDFSDCEASDQLVATAVVAPSLSTSRETLMIEELLSPEGENRRACDVVDGAKRRRREPSEVIAESTREAADRAA